MDFQSTGRSPHGRIMGASSEIGEDSFSGHVHFQNSNRRDLGDVGCRSGEHSELETTDFHPTRARTAGGAYAKPLPVVEFEWCRANSKNIGGLQRSLQEPVEPVPSYGGPVLAKMGTRRTKWFEDVPAIQPGNLVIIVDDQVRNGWIRGRVVQVVKGSDGRIRQAVLQTATGLVRRPIAKLALLDIAESKAAPEKPEQLTGRGDVTVDSAGPSNNSRIDSTASLRSFTPVNTSAADTLKRVSNSRLVRKTKANLELHE